MASSSGDAYPQKPVRAESLLRGFSFLDAQQLHNAKGWSAADAIDAARPGRCVPLDS